MLKLGWAVAASAFFLATTSAHAVDVGVTAVDFVANNDLGTHGGVQSLPGNGAGNYDNDGAGGDYSSYVHVTPELVSWKSDNAISGNATFTSSSQVDITFVNPNVNNTPHLISDIVPAGFGFFMADFGEGGCSISTISSCQLDHNSGFGGLPNGGRGSPVFASFTFEVFSNEQLLTSVTGTVSLTRSTGEVSTWVPTYSLDDPDNLLQDFALATAPNSYNAFGFAWGENPLDVELLSGVATQVVSYRTSVTTFVDGSLACVIDGSGCLVAYSGFGDPIGRGGGDSIALDFTAFSEGTGGGGFGANAEIGGIAFGEAHFRFPTVDQDGNLVFDLIDVTSTAVPEPATWALMIGGFGLMGAALRRRRVSAYT